MNYGKSVFSQWTLRTTELGSISADLEPSDLVMEFSCYRQLHVRPPMDIVHTCRFCRFAINGNDGWYLKSGRLTSTIRGRW